MIWIATAAGALAARGESQPGEVFVSAVQGGAEYSTDHHSWNRLEPGLILGPGAELRTSFNATADLVLKHCGTALRLLPKSHLTLTRLEETFTGEEIITRTRLDLRSGGIVGSQRKLSRTSTFDISTPTATATIRGTEYVVRADGAVSCLEGAVSVKYITSGHGPPLTVNVPSGFSFDPATGQVVTTTPAYLHNLIAHVNAVRNNARVFKVGKARVVVKPEGKISPIGGDDDGDHGHHGGDDDDDGGHGHGHGNDHRDALAHAFLLPSP